MLRSIGRALLAKLTLTRRTSHCSRHPRVVLFSSLSNTTKYVRVLGVFQRVFVSMFHLLTTSRHASCSVLALDLADVQEG